MTCAHEGCIHRAAYQGARFGLEGCLCAIHYRRALRGAGAARAYVRKTGPVPRCSGCGTPEGYRVRPGSRPTRYQAAGGPVCHDCYQAHRKRKAAEAQARRTAATPPRGGGDPDALTHQSNAGARERAAAIRAKALGSAELPILNRWASADDLKPRAAAALMVRIFPRRLAEARAW